MRGILLRARTERSTVTLDRLGRGLYAAPGYQPGEHQALVAVAKRAPRALFCLLTALRLHELTTQAPFEVWIAIGNKANPPRLDYPPMRVVRYSAESLTAGVEEHKVGGTAIRVTSIAKTVADCFKFRSKIGLEVALEALREARRSVSRGGDVNAGTTASVHARLLALAKSRGEDFNLTLNRYGLER